MQFHVNEDPGFNAKGRDLCRYRCEIEAYRLLSEAGTCEQGFVPNFYTLFEDIDPLTFTPHLDAFLYDLHHPCAILLEYLPSAQKLNCVNYSRDRIQSAILGIRAVHRARVLHNDPYPKNVLIVPGSESRGIDDRVVWIDFDIAINFGSEKFGGVVKYDESKEFAFEQRLVEGYGMMLVSLLPSFFPVNGGILFFVYTHIYLGRGSEEGSASEYEILLMVNLNAHDFIFIPTPSAISIRVEYLVTLGIRRIN